MKVERHFAKGEAFERQQAKLDDADDVEMIVEGCFFAARHFINAGAIWTRERNPTSSAHARNPNPLYQAGAPRAIKRALDELDRLHIGNVWGGRPPIAAPSRSAREHLAQIRAWVAAARP